MSVEYIVRMARLEATIRLVAKDDMLFWFSDENAIDGTHEFPYLVINCNDYFVPAADCERVEWNDVIEVSNIYGERGEDGVLEWIAKKRNIENIHWKDKLA